MTKNLESLLTRMMIESCDTADYDDAEKGDEAGGELLTLHMVDIVDPPVVVKDLLPAHRQLVSNAVSEALGLRQAGNGEVLHQSRVSV